MTSRDYKVTATLAAKVGDYVSGLGKAIAVTNRLRDAQQGGAASARELAESLTVAGASARESAAGLQAMARDARTLERRIAALVREQQRLRDLPPIPTPDGPGPGPGPDPRPRPNPQDGQRFLDKLADGVPAPVTAAIVAGAVVAAPLAGAVVGAGLLAGIAGVGIGAGVAAALQDQAIKGQVAALGKDFHTLANRIGADFKDEVGYSIRLLDKGIGDLGPGLRTALAPAASYLKPLTIGFEGFVQEMLPGLGEGIAAAEPIITMLSDELPILGATIGDAFSTLGEHSDQFAAGLEHALAIGEVLISVGAGLLGWLGDAYVKLLEMAYLTADVATVLPDWLGGSQAEGLKKDLGVVLQTANGIGKTKTALSGLAGESSAAGAATAAFTMQQQVLNGSLSEGIALAGGFTNALDALNGANVSAREAEIAYQESIDNVSKSIKENGRSLDTHTEKGRNNQKALLGVQKAAEQRAQAAYDQALATGTQADAEDAGAKSIEAGRKQLIASYMQYDKNKGRAEAYANSVLKIPKQWQTKVRLTGVDESMANLATLMEEAERFAGKNYTATARLTYVRVGKPFSGIQSGIGGSSTRGNLRGGAYTPMAAGGVGDVYPASNPPLYRFAEPETGGELFLPRKGSKERGRDLLSVGASWYGMRMVPLAKGGIQAAASGLVNVAASSTTRTSRMDSTSAYLSARDSVGSLNQSLKDNGRSFSFATSKGRQNVSALFGVIKAAEESAKAKYDETGSVTAANRAYDEHITRLRRTLAQQKINASTTRQLLGYAVRPQFGTGGPQDSGANIAFAKSAIGAASGLADLKDSLSLNKASMSVLTPEGQQNLTAIISFLEAASQAAQDKLSQTGSSKAATILYNTFVGQLTAALRQNGYTSAQINSLVRSYGRITLQPNAAGGVYGSGLSQAMALPPGETLYQWREPGTGGEAFVPRYGDRARSERILQVAAGWHGGSYTPAAQAGGGGATVNNNFTVHNNRDPLTLSTFNAMRREADSRARVGFNR